MTKLMVKPIDMKQRGSHAERRKIVRALGRYQEMQEKRDIRLLDVAWGELEALLPRYLTTDDGSDPVALLAEISGTPYITVIKIAAIPAILYYASVAVIIRLEAVKQNLQGQIGRAHV